MITQDETGTFTMTSLTTIAAPRERPIIFSGTMIRAILDGRKTQTRRVVKHEREVLIDEGDPYQKRKDDGKPGFDREAYDLIRCPYGAVGDRLWVREACAPWPHKQPHERVRSVFYKADESCYCINGSGILDEAFTDFNSIIWTPSIHMPRWASRITLTITDIRVERLQSITTEDAKTEGVERGCGWTADEKEYDTIGYRGAYSRLWDKINGKKHPWSANPWVWVVSFKRLEATDGQG